MKNACPSKWDHYNLLIVSNFMNSSLEKLVGNLYDDGYKYKNFPSVKQ